MLLRSCLGSALLGIGLLTFAPGCEDDDDDGAAVNMPDTSEADKHCSDLYLQDHLPTYHVVIAPNEWNALQDEFLNRPAREAAGLDIKPYHPIELRYDGMEVPNAMIRLKGQSSWLEAIAFDKNPKMQFVISFNEIDKGGRFKGVRKVELDMPRTDASFLRQRLALYYLRRAGVTAQCANNARLYINGEYYGLYTHLERLDKEFLQRHYGSYDEGDLWKGGREIKTNEETFSWDRLTAFWSHESLANLEAVADIETSVSVWAHESIIPHGDGYYNGRANYFLYDHPVNGFTWIPHDLDAAFDFVPATLSPMYPECMGRNVNDREHWALVFSDRAWLQKYRTDVATARDALDVDHMQELLIAMAGQIELAAVEDPRKPFLTDVHYFAVDALYTFLPERAATIDAWLDCWANGGEDLDGDGFEFCNDCADGDPTRHPGAPEVCNGLDDNCDGQFDEPEVGGPCG